MVKVTITTPDGEVLEMFTVAPGPRPRSGELDGPIKLAAIVKDHIEHRFEVED
jgi:hypothetical protein